MSFLLLSVVAARADWPETVLWGGSPGDAQSTALADVDGDGDADLVVAIGSSGQLLWFEDTGPTFSHAAVVIDALAGDPRQVRAADLEGDGDLDLFLSRGPADRALFLYENLGGGVFAPAVPVGAVVGPAGFALGDLDGNGWVDVVTGPDDSGALRWIPSDGVAFGAPSLVGRVPPGWFLPAETRAVEVADVDLDGALDVVTAVALGWFRGVGDGTFGRLEQAQPINVTELVCADLDADGDPDLASCSGAGCVRIENLGGAYDSGMYVVGPRAGLAGGGIGAGDYDGDGVLDLVTARVSEVQVHTAASSFDGARSGSLSGAVDVGLLDVDDDGRTDVVAAGPAPGVSWLPQLASGQLGARVAVTTSSNSGEVVLGDVDGDGEADLVTGTDGLSWFPVRGGDVGDAVVLAQEVYEPVSLHLADLDGDGDLDVVHAGREPGWVPNRGGGQFGPERRLDALCESTVSTGDLDGDGDLDLACGGGSGWGWYENTGGGTFSAVRDRSGSDVAQVLLADLDADGRPEVLTTLWREQSCPACPYGYTGEYVTELSAFDGTSVVRFASYPVADPDTRFAVADLDADGLGDVVLGTGIGLASWRRNLGGGSFSDPVVLDASGGTARAAVGDVDLDGVPDVVSAWSSGRVSWSRGLGAGAFAPPETISETAAGAAGLAIVATTAGARVLVQATERDALVQYADGSTAPEPAEHTGAPDDDPPAHSTATEDGPEAPGRAKGGGGCGCDGSGGGAGAAALLALAQLRRRRAGPS